ncbi:MAG: response regulator, partial [Ideonella sp.]
MRILLVEDDAVLSRTMTCSLEQAGHRVQVASNVDDAHHWWRVQAFDAVLLDLNLPQSDHERSGLGSGLTVLRAARARGNL